MQRAIRNLSGRAEFALVVVLSLSYYIASSAYVLLRRITRFEITTGRALRGVLIEALLLAIVLMILRVRGWSAERLGLRFSFLAVLGGIPLFLAAMLWYWTTAFAALLLFPAVAKTQVFQFVMTATPAAVIAFIVVNSFFEEIIVTGYVVTALSGEGAAFSVTASTLLRFLYHLYQGPFASISILPLGLLFGAVYWRSRNLWPLIVAHTITNLLSFYLVSGRS